MREDLRDLKRLSEVRRSHDRPARQGELAAAEDAELRAEEDEGGFLEPATGRLTAGAGRAR